MVSRSKSAYQERSRRPPTATAARSTLSVSAKKSLRHSYSALDSFARYSQHNASAARDRSGGR